MSKSGLFAHFGSKEELQLATVDAAAAVFAEHVTDPAGSAGSGLDRVRMLTEGYLDYVEDRVFPGGCFFASLVVEMGSRAGPVHDLAAQFMDDWMHVLESAVRDAQAEGAIETTLDPQQLAFDLEASLFLANARFVLGGDPLAITRARRAILDRLALVTTT